MDKYGSREVGKEIILIMEWRLDFVNSLKVEFIGFFGCRDKRKRVVKDVIKVFGLSDWKNGNVIF